MKRRAVSGISVLVLAKLLVVVLSVQGHMLVGEAQ